MLKIAKNDQGKDIIKISKKDWELIGIRAGWIKKAQINPPTADNTNPIEPLSPLNPDQAANEIIPNDEPDFKDEPLMGDYSILSDTYKGTTVSIVGGGKISPNLRRKFNNVKEAAMACQADMEVNNYYPNIWVTEDKGDPYIYTDGQ